MIAAKASRWLAGTSRRGLALVLALTAVANLLGVWLAHPWPAATEVADIADLNQPGWGRLGLVVGIGGLLLLARASARGKRHAWVLVLCLLALALVSAVIEREPLLIVLGLLAMLLGTLLIARYFPRGGNAWAAARGYTAVAIGVLLAVETVPLHHLLHHLLARLAAGRGSGPYAMLTLGLPLVLALLLGYGVVEVLRPASAAHPPAVEERVRAREVVRRYGWLAVHHFAANTDKRYFWSASGRSLIAYRLTHGVALALGDPIGLADELPALLRDFIAYCRRQDWPVAFYQASADLCRAGRTERLSGIRIGQEAMLDVARFTLQGKAAAPVRHAVARAERAGLTVQCWHGEAPPPEVFAAMRRVSAAWLRAQPVRTQMGFSMGRFPEDWSPDLLTAVAMEPDGVVAGFLTWTPLYAGDGWACDNMRRSPDAPPGTMELLVAETLRWAAARGAARMSLGLAPLANYDCASAGSERRADRARVAPLALAEHGAMYLHQQGLLLGRYRSLAFFKAKFQPNWEARYLLVNDLDRLPRVVLALAAALGAMPRARRGAEGARSTPL